MITPYKKHDFYGLSSEFNQLRRQFGKKPIRKSSMKSSKNQRFPEQVRTEVDRINRKLMSGKYDYSALLGTLKAIDNTFLNLEQMERDERIVNVSIPPKPIMVESSDVVGSGSSSNSQKKEGILTLEDKPTVTATPGVGGGNTTGSGGGIIMETPSVKPKPSTKSKMGEKEVSLLGGEIKYMVPKQRRKGAFGFPKSGLRGVAKDISFMSKAKTSFLLDKIF